LLATQEEKNAGKGGEKSNEGAGGKQKEETKVVGQKKEVALNNEKPLVANVPAKEVAATAKVDKQLEQVPEGESKSDSKQIKALMKQRPASMTFWWIGGIAVLVAAIMYYLSDESRQELKLTKAIHQISSPLLENKLEGLTSLEELFFIKKKLISGTTEIPLPKHVLVDQGLVESLLDALETGDDAIKERAGVWLLRLTQDPEGRRRIASSGALNMILTTIYKAPVGSPVWIVNSALLLELTHYPELGPAFLSAQATEVVKKMVSASNPLGTLLSAHIISNLAASGLSLDVGAKVPYKELTTPPMTAALYAAIGEIVPEEPIPHNPALGDAGPHLAWAVVFSLLGNLYGKIRWTTRGITKGLGFSESSKFAAKQNRVGRSVFLLLTLDLVAQALMSWPEEGLKVPYTDQVIQLPKLPQGWKPETVVPIGEATIFTAASLYLIRRQRYIVAPLIAASAYSHQADLINLYKVSQEFAKPWGGDQQQGGK